MRSKGAVIRVSEQTHESLKRLAKEQHTSITALVESATELLDRKAFFQAMNHGLADLKRDPKAWAEYKSEVASLDGALQDGLADEEWSSTDFT